MIDTSCSMAWDVASYTTADGSPASGPRIARAKAELVRSVSGLAENFRFNIIEFDCGSTTWRDTLVAATDANKQSAMSWVMGLHPTGATGTAPAVALALSERGNKLVVLLTDGAPNCGVGSSAGGGMPVPGGVVHQSGPREHRRVIRRANVNGATINVFGIAASGSYRAFCQGVASDSGGSYFDVP